MQRKMNRRIRTTITLITMVISLGIYANAQEPARIHFAKGKNTAVIKGTTGPYGRTYVLRAKSGQKLVLKLTPESTLGIKVETVGRFGEMVLLRETNGGYFEIGLEETGDYTIFIGPLGRNPITYSLTVKIGKLTDI